MWLREWVWGVSFRPLNDSCNKNNFFSIFIAVLTVLSNWEGLRTLLANMQHQVQDPNGSASVDWRSGFSYCHPTRQNVKSPEGLMRIFYTRAFHRTTGETKMNHVSSRSHALLTQVIKQKVKSSTFIFLSRLSSSRSSYPSSLSGENFNVVQKCCDWSSLDSFGER